MKAWRFGELGGTRVRSSISRRPPIASRVRGSDWSRCSPCRRYLGPAERRRLHRAIADILAEAPSQAARPLDWATHVVEAAEPGDANAIAVYGGRVDGIVFARPGIIEPVVDKAESEGQWFLAGRTHFALACTGHDPSAPQGLALRRDTARGGERARLTAAEVQLATMVRDGLSNRQIADS